MPQRKCSQCDRYFPARLPGSGLKASICSVQCERLEQQQKAQAAQGRRDERVQATRAGGEGMASMAARRTPDIPEPFHPGPWPITRIRNKRRHSRPKGWTRNVFELYGDQCLSCGHPAVQAHHVVARTFIANAHHLSPMQRRNLEYDPVNGMPLCVRCHEKHEQAYERLYFRMIPAPAVEWALANGFASRIMDDRIYLGHHNRKRQHEAAAQGEGCSVAG